MPGTVPRWSTQVPPEERIRRLRHLSEDNRAEAIEAGEEIVALAEHYESDFGTLGPDPA